jgi:HAE1 family hydrophobic/amphiphilic exporter-1
VANGAGAESQKVIGTAVFGGMVIATLVSLAAIPMLYYVIQVISEKFGGRPAGGPAETAATPEPAP